MRMVSGRHSAARLGIALLAASLLGGPSLADHEVGTTGGGGEPAAVGRRPPGTQGTPPAILVTPSSLSFDLYSGGHDARALHVENLGGSSLTFTVDVEQSFPVRTGPLLGRPCSSGPGGPPGPGNRLGGSQPEGSRSCTAFGVGSPLVLVYTDEAQRSPGTTLIDLALQALGVPYTAYYSDPSGFASALASQGWDLVVVDQSSYYEIGTHWEALRTYLESGGRLLVTTFDVDGSNSNPTGLWADFGAAPAGDILATALPVYRWEPGHPIFTTPESVPDFIQMAPYYYDNGDLLSVTPPADPVGGFMAFPAPGQAAIVV